MQYCEIFVTRFRRSFLNFSNMDEEKHEGRLLHFVLNCNITMTFNADRLQEMWAISPTMVTE